LPGFRPRTGDQIRLVDTTDETTSGVGEQEGPPPAPQSWQAVVAGIEGAEGGNFLGGSGTDEWTIDLIVSERDADLIARLAANDNLYLAILPGQSGD
jgi:hypothetical protein